MKQLIKVEFKRNLKSFILWAVIISGLAALELFLFPAFEDSFDGMESFLDMFPQAFLEAFGMGEGGLDITTIYGWFGIEAYLFVTLIGGSYAAILGGSILSKEEDEKTIEFLMSKPISRSHVFFGKVIVVGINILLLNVVMSIVLLISFSVLADLEVVVWLLYSFAPIILHIIFASLSLLISIFVTKSRIVLSISLGIVLGMYVVKLISTLTDAGEFLKYFTPYEYIDAEMLYQDHMIKPLYLLLSIGIVAISLVSAWRLYMKKDFVA